MSTLDPCPWPARSLDLIPPQPLLWVSPEVLSISNEPEESPRSPGGDEIVGAPRVAFRMPRPGGGCVTSGKLRLERKVDYHEYVPSAPQANDPVRWIPHSNKISLNRLSFDTRFDTLAPIHPEIYNF